MHVEFTRRRGGGSLATIDRPDGARLLLTSYDRAHAIPHDLAHFVVERELRFTRGLWGSIVAGAMFDSLRQLAGPRRHDATARSKAIRREHAADLSLAEILAGAVHSCVADPAAAARAVERAWASVRQTPCPFPVPARIAAVDELRRLGAAFGRLDDGDTLPLDWPGDRRRRHR